MVQKTNSARQKIHYKVYKDSDKRGKNKARKLAKHVKNNPNDKQSVTKVAKPIDYRSAEDKANIAREKAKRLELKARKKLHSGK